MWINGHTTFSVGFYLLLTGNFGLYCVDNCMNTSFFKLLYSSSGVPLQVLEKEQMTKKRWKMFHCVFHQWNHLTRVTLTAVYSTMK